ncbi:MAG: uridine kinase [Woeseiaceae bacterium]
MQKFVDSMGRVRDNAIPMKQVMIIGIAGGSCSGKTRLLRRLAERLGPENCSVILQDDYYFSKPAAAADNLRFNFDHPDALDFDLLARDLAMLKQGETIHSPQYDFAKHVRIDGKTRRIEPRPVVLVDGILILDSEPVRQMLDHSVFIRCDAETRLQRRIKRDVKERGREPDNVVAQFEQQVQPMHMEFVSPSAEHADAVYEQPSLNGNEALDELSDFCLNTAEL